MTLKPIESEFSSQLVNQLNASENVIDLSLQGPILDSLPPQILHKKIELELGPQQETTVSRLNDWYLHCFETITEAKSHFPDAQIFGGHPHDFASFLGQAPQVALIDFSPLGVVYLSKQELPAQTGTETHLHLLPLWLRYASSNDLWGEVGKWTRFHSELHQLFKDKNLLISEDHPGYYPLKKELKAIEAFGFQGSELDQTYLLVLPWSFSLTALKKLVKVIQQEF